MSLTLLKDLLLYSLVINYLVLLLWFVVFSTSHGWLYRLHSRWFALSEERFDSLHYAGMTLYKVGVLLFNLSPWLALQLAT